MNRNLVIGALVVLAASGCAKDAPPVASAPGSPVTLLPSLPQPQAGDVIRSTRLAFVGPFTELRIEVFGVDEMQRVIMTDEEGHFAFTLLGTVAADGKKTEIIAQETR